MYAKPGFAVELMRMKPDAVVVLTAPIIPILRMRARTLKGGAAFDTASSLRHNQEE
jgi:hypothetical protein